MAVKFGIHIGQQKATVQQLRDLWTYADGAGADWISLWDHLYEAPPEGGTQPHFEAFSLLGALAVDTKRARLGCLVFCSAYRNIGVLMKGFVSLDHLSGGRFEPGLGSGWHDGEARAYGIHFPSQGARFRMLEEQIEVVDRWKQGEERVSFSGEYVMLEEASMLPAPMGKLPLWIGGVGPNKTLRMAGQYAQGWNAAYITAEKFGELNTILDGWCEKADRHPCDVERSINLTFSMSWDDPQVVRERLTAQWGPGAERIIGGSLMGRPSDVMEQLAPYVENRADLINVVIRPPWDQELLAAYFEEVVPEMRREWS
ncbi:MAG: LLM class flavin-dependent oxidoreductase [Ilumatobacteraceae bacterium]|jgi:alkanesulfonate monooxygenase SsuD/methylene tetrahydromethanopterin reductase-like flavin-dependent oxidoreductase (luciferase family)|nr:LLM class flavin-dependent oxidoreductase [Ilumatobacteraceae bacterium]